MYDVKDFIDAVNNSEGLVCYGVGKRFRIFEKFFKDSLIKDKLLFCVDKNDELHGTNIRFGDRDIEIKPIEALLRNKNKQIIILITNFKYQEIREKLVTKKIVSLINIFCFTHLFMILLEESALKEYVPKELKISSELVIPKIIHYCWFGGNPIPEKYQYWMQSWRKYCPDYEIREWNEDNYDITKHEYMYEAYKNKKWGFVSDYARLDIIYEQGGIYLDTDVELIQNMDDLLYQKGFAAFEQSYPLSYVALGLGFGAMKGLPIIKEMRDYYDKIQFANLDGSLNLTACPYYQTEVLKSKGLKLDGTYQIINDFTVYPEKMLSGKSLCTRRIRLTEYTRSIHHYEGSWVDDEMRNMNLQFEKEMNT